MGGADDDDLLDLIYEAAVDPDLWITVMERFADRVGGTSAWLSRLNLADATGPGLVARIDPVMPALYLDHFADLNPLARVGDPVAYKQSWSLRILTDEDWMPKDALTATEYYNDFLRPQDVHSTMMIRLALRGDEVSALSVNRPRARGQFDRADLEQAERLHPHLVRAFRLSGALSELSLAGHDLAEALDRSANGVLLLDPSGRIRHANTVADRVLATGQGLCVVSGRLGAAQEDMDRRLSALVGRAAIGIGGKRCGGTMTIPAPGAGPPLTITVSPARSHRLSVFNRSPAVLVMITDPFAGSPPTQAALRERFGLTPAEARVALDLLAGRKLREVAERLGVSVHTVRNQLRSVFEKTGATRQSQLVATLLQATEVHG